jgi:inosine-uridine nucleoside N-ribohydrolase
MAREYGGELNVVAVGPLTNVALACRLDPQFAANLRRLVVMGGAATVAGNVTPAAEANFYNDPEAASIVFQSGARLTMVGLDVTLRTLFPAAGYQELRARVEAGVDAVARLAVAVLDRYLAADSATGLTGSPLHDPLAVGALAQPAVLTCRPLHVEIETDGRITAGQSVVNVAGHVEQLTDLGDHDDVAGLSTPVPNCNVALDVDATRFLTLFRDRLGLHS